MSLVERLIDGFCYGNANGYIYARPLYINMSMHLTDCYIFTSANSQRRPVELLLIYTSVEANMQ